MDEEKKSEASWDEPKQVGPYQLQEEVQQDDASRWECYRATHQRSAGLIEETILPQLVSNLARGGHLVW